MPDLPEGYKSFPLENGPTSKIVLTLALIVAFPVGLIFMGLVFLFVIYQGLGALGFDIFEAARGIIPANLRLILKLLGLLYISIYLFLLVKIWSGVSFKRLRKAFYVWVIILIVGGVGIGHYNRSLYVLDDNNFWHGRYTPFMDDSMAARLPQSANLMIDSEWPEFGVQKEFYPAAAAFVQATYSYEIEKDDLGWYKHNCKYIKDSGYETSFSSLLHSHNDLIIVEELSQEQLAKAGELGVTLRIEPLGKTALVFFAYGGNKIADLTKEQILTVYSGQVTNWRQLGGPGKVIQAYQHGKRYLSQKWLMEIMGNTKIIKPEIIIGNDWGQEYEYVVTYKNYQNALGFTLYNYIQPMLRNKNMKVLSVDGVLPDNASIAKGTYPFTTTFYVVTRADANPNTDRLIDWMLSPQGQYLIEAAGYVPIGSTELVSP